MVKKLEKTIRVFKALSCKTRFKIILQLINKNECNVNTIAEELNLPQPNISQHLATLKSAGIIEGFRKGNQIYYKLVNKQTKKIVKSLNLE